MLGSSMSGVEVGRRARRRRAPRPWPAVRSAFEPASADDLGVAAAPHRIDVERADEAGADDAPAPTSRRPRHVHHASASAGSVGITRAQEGDALLEALVDREQRVLVLDREDVVVAGQPQRR